MTKLRITIGIAIILLATFDFILWESNKDGNKNNFETSNYSPLPSTNNDTGLQNTGIKHCPSVNNFWIRGSGGGKDNYAISEDGRLQAFADGGKLYVKDKNSNIGKNIVEIPEAPNQDPEKNLTGFYNLRFSIDNKELYFITDAWTTSGAIHGVNLETGQTKFVTDGDIFAIIPSGEYAGKIIVRKHKYFVGPGSYDWYWLVDPRTGKEIGPIGESIDEFYDIYICGNSF